MRLEKRSRAYALGIAYGAVIFLVASAIMAGLGMSAIGLKGANWLFLAGIVLILLGFVFALVNFFQRVLHLPMEQLSGEALAPYREANLRLGILTMVDAILIAGGAVVFISVIKRPEWIGPYLGVLIGLHLIAGAPVYGTHNDYWLAGGILLVTFLAVFVHPRDFPGWNALIGFSSMGLVWLSILGRLGLGSRVLRVLQNKS